MSQTDRLEQLLLDGEPHRTDEILKAVYGSEHLGIARIGARIADLKKRGYVINGWRDNEIKTLYWYEIAKAPKEEFKPVPNFDVEKRAAIARTIKAPEPKERTLFG